MGKRWRGEIPADEERCTRNDGKAWRCYIARFSGTPFCEKHHLNYLSKCSSSRPKPKPKPNPNPSPQPQSPTPAKKPMSRSPNAKPSPRFSKARVFEPNQIWAISFQSNDLPSHYVRIDRKIASESSILITPLISHPILEEEVVSVDIAGRILSCGTFRTSSKKPRLLIDTSLLQFRIVGFKIITWMGIPFYRIFPNKGEVWAVNSKEGGDLKLVEILTEFSEEEGVTVGGLVSVDGLGDGVYGRHLHEGFRLVQSFERKEMVMFERRVLAERVEGGEGDNQLWK